MHGVAVHRSKTKLDSGRGVGAGAGAADGAALKREFVRGNGVDERLLVEADLADFVALLVRGGIGGAGGLDEIVVDGRLQELAREIADELRGAADVADDHHFDGGVLADPLDVAEDENEQEQNEQADDDGDPFADRAEAGEGTEAEENGG